jgi:hypothetical protein
MGGSHLRRRRAAVAAAVLVAVIAALATNARATPPSGQQAGQLTLEIAPGGGPQPAGGTQTLQAEVTQPNGDGADGVEVDFEVTQGPGDTDGDTPQSPDMSCTTAGAAKKKAATCTVTYRQPSNAGGSDAVRAWIDADGADSTVEADLGEGENQTAPGPGACAPNTKGEGDTPEPDGTDCVEKRWKARVPTVLNVQPETSSGPPGTTTWLYANVLDQFGGAFRGTGTGTTVRFELLAGSANDPGDGTDFASPDLGSCDTGTTGGCSIPFTASTPGVDRICAYLPDASSSCSEPLDAPELDNGADVVQRTWEAPAADQVTPPPPPPPVPPAKPLPPAKPDPPEKPGHPRPKSDDEPGQASDPSSPPAATAGRDPSPARSVEAGSVRSPSIQRAAEVSHHPAKRRRARPAPHHARAHRAPAPKPSAPRRHAVVRAPRARAGHHARRLQRRLGELSRAAVRTANRFSFPLGLTLMVIAFLAVQGRIDRRDPKLRLAPVDSKHDLVHFT